MLYHFADLKFMFNILCRITHIFSLSFYLIFVFFLTETTLKAEYFFFGISKMSIFWLTKKNLINFLSLFKV